MSMLFKAILFVVIGFFVQRLCVSLLNAGIFRQVFNHRPGPCNVVPGFDNGSEDFVHLPDHTVLISHGLGYIRIGNPKDFASTKGEFSVFDMKKPDKGAIKLKIVKTSGLILDLDLMQPHGMGFYQDGKDGYLFVVNHHPNHESVEKFKYSPAGKTLTHVKTYTSDLFIFINDVLPIGPDAFYVTNSLRLYNMPYGIKYPEFLFELPITYTLVYEKGQARKVASGTLMNGINQSPDKKFVYISDKSHGMGVSVYRRLDNNDLEYTTLLYFNGNGVDNIEVLSNGDIVLGTQPIALKSGDKLNDRFGAKCPSQVLYVRMKDPETIDTITSLLGDDGTFIDGASVATMYENRLLIGTYHEKLAFCDVIVPIY